MLFFSYEKDYFAKKVFEKKWFINHSNNVLENHKLVGLLRFVKNEYNSNKERNRYFFCLQRIIKCVISLTSVTSDVVYIILFIV